MATYNFTDGSITGVEKPHDTTPRGYELFVLRNIVDCTKQTLDAGDGDVAQVINVPAGTLVLYAFINVRTAEGSNGTVDLGYGGNADQWGDALAVDATGIAQSPILTAPVFFNAADTIDITATVDTADVDIDGAVLEVVAVCLAMNDSIDAGGDPT